MSTSGHTPKLYLPLCSQWAHDEEGSFLCGMLALQACTYEEGVMVGGDPTEDALEVRSQTERLQIDRV